MFKPLLFLPDESAGAVAEPPAEPTEPPKPPIPEEESVPPEEPVSEDAAAAEGEAPPADETPKPDEDVPLDDQIAELMVEAAKASPAAVEKLIDSLPEEEQAKYRTSDTERAAIEAEQSQTARTTQLNTAYQAYQPYSQPVNTAEWTGWADGVARDARDAVRVAIRDGKEDADVLPADFSQLVTGLANYGNNLRTSQQDYLSNVYQNGLMATLTAHPSYRLLSKEGRTETDVVKLLTAQLDAAGQADPKGLKKEMKAQLEKELDVDTKKVELVERLQKITGGNGRKATKADAPTPRPADTGTVQWAEDTPVSELATIRAKQRAQSE